MSSNGFCYMQEKKNYWVFLWSYFALYLRLDDEARAKHKNAAATALNSVSFPSCMSG